MDISVLGNLIGLGGPAAAALAFYSLFKFLDLKASDNAKQTIGAWMKSENYKSIDLRMAVLDGFDHIYGPSLYTRTAFVRSGTISCLVLVIYSLFLRKTLDWRVDWEFAPFVMISTVLSDYSSLFVVKITLRMAQRNLTKSVALSLLYACVVIATIYLIAGFLMALLVTSWFSGFVGTPKETFLQIVERVVATGLYAQRI